MNENERIIHKNSDRAFVNRETPSTILFSLK